MNVNANSTTANGGRSRKKRRKRNKNASNSTKSEVNTWNQRNSQNNYENEHDQFIASFQLNISAASSPILVRNEIRKVGNNCYSARMIKKYFENSNPHNVNIYIKQIWKVHNVRHYAQFMQNSYDEVDNMLLWHGTSRKNLISILQNNLMLPVAPTNGHMFGPGIYFADRMSKSANYTDKSGPMVFLLCQVALGRKWRVFEAENFYYAPDDFDTLKAVGRYVPDIEDEEMLGDYCRIPCGQTISHPDSSVWSSTSLQYNEYIVFDQDRIRIKFIIHCERGVSTSSYVAPAIPRNTRNVVRTTNSNQSTTQMIQSNTVPRQQPASTTNIGSRNTNTNTNISTSTQNSTVRSNMNSGLPIIKTNTVPSVNYISSGLANYPRSISMSNTIQSQTSTILPFTSGVSSNQIFTRPTHNSGSKNKKKESNCCVIL